jgi:hypothetical protein
MLPWSAPTLWAMRVIREVHSIGPVILKLSNHCVTNHFNFSYHDKKYFKLIIMNKSNIISRKKRNRKPLMHEPQSRMLNIIATRFEITDDHLAGDARLEGMTVEVLDDFVEVNLAFL